MLKKVLLALGATAIALSGLLVSTSAASDAAAAGPGVRFSRVQYDSPGSDTGSNASLNAEWARITNSTATKKTLTGWTVRDPQGHVYKFPTFTLASGASVRLHTGSGSNTKSDVYWKQSFYVWNNTGDKAILKNKAGTTIDSCSWGDGAGAISC
jgi:Lamin Tail Domain